jgi:hypothetical protein
MRSQPRRKEYLASLLYFVCDGVFTPMMMVIYPEFPLDMFQGIRSFVVCCQND